MLLQDLSNLVDLCIQTLREAINFNDQDGSSVQRQTGMCEGLDDRDKLAIHHFHGGWHQTSGNDARNCLTGLLDRIKNTQQRLDTRRVAQKAYRYGDD